MSGNRSKKNGKKNKFLNTNGVFQVKSVKLDTNKSNSKDDKPNSKSEDNFLRKPRKLSILKNLHDHGEDEPMISEGNAAELETSLVKKMKTLSLSSEGENDVPSTSALRTGTEGTRPVTKQNANNEENDISLVMEYCPELSDDNTEKPVEQYDSSYKYYAKNSKSIKFTNQVTVLYFNGEDILCESMEPLKKEQEQQIRNKEMRKEHLMSKGPIDNLYLF